MFPREPRVPLPATADAAPQPVGELECIPKISAAEDPFCLARSVVLGLFRRVEKIQITLYGLPQLMLRVVAAPAVLAAPVIIPVRVADGAQVAKRRLQFRCSLRTLGFRRGRHPRTRRGGSRHQGASFRLAGQARSNVNIVAILRGRRACGLAWSCGPPHSERRFVSCTAEIMSPVGPR